MKAFSNKMTKVSYFIKFQPKHKGKKHFSGDWIIFFQL